MQKMVKYDNIHRIADEIKGLANFSKIPQKDRPVIRYQSSVCIFDTSDNEVREYDRLDEWV